MRNSKFKISLFLLPLTLFLGLFIVTTKPASAFLLEGTECEYGVDDPALSDCHEECVNNIGSIPSVDVWCTGNVSGECSQELNDTGTANLCNCFCTLPLKDIECRYMSDCAQGQSCVTGTCQEPGGFLCNPLLSGADCWLPQGPCDPNDPLNDRTFCVDEDLDGTGICYCNTTQFFGEPTPLVIFCDREGNPTNDAQSGKLWTAVGCIPIVDDVGNMFLTEFTKFWLRMGMSIGGGIALLLIAVSGILMKMSAGNPERVKSATAIFLAALTGLLFLIFSVFILRVTGVQILGIPGLGL